MYFKVFLLRETFSRRGWSSAVSVSLSGLLLESVCPDFVGSQQLQSSLI